MIFCSNMTTFTTSPLFIWGGPFCRFQNLRATYPPHPVVAPLLSSGPLCRYCCDAEHDQFVVMLRDTAVCFCVVSAIDIMNINDVYGVGRSVAVPWWTFVTVFCVHRPIFIARPRSNSATCWHCGKTAKPIVKFSHRRIAPPFKSP